MDHFRWFFNTSSRFEDMSPNLARLIGILLIGSMVWGAVRYKDIHTNDETVVKENQEQDKGDLNLYKAIVKRIQAGESYYSAVNVELKERHYARKPFWNWRLPTLACLLGKFPSIYVAYCLFIGMAILELCLWWNYWLKNEGIINAKIGVLLLLPTVFGCFNISGLYFHEFWAGNLISLSIAALGNRYFRLSLFFAIGAVFFRELALLYVFILILNFFRTKQYLYCSWGCLGVLLFGLYLWIHYLQVCPYYSDQELTNRWVAFNGWIFVLSTVQFSGWFLISPNYVTLVLVPVSILGIIGYRSTISFLLSTTILIYVFFFMIVGRMDNIYWGMLYAPIFSTGLLYSPAAMKAWYKKSFQFTERTEKKIS